MTLRKIIGRAALFLALAVGLSGVASAQAPAQANASATLSWVQAQTLTASISTPALTFTGSTPTTQSFSTTTTWNLGTESNVYEEFYLGSSTSALANGANNIPSSDVFASTGGTFGPCTGTATSPVAGVTAGAECFNWQTAITNANRVGSHSFPTLTLQLQGVGALPTGTYTGVFNYSVFAQ